MIGEEGVYRAAKNEYLELTDLMDPLVDSIGMRVNLKKNLLDRYHLHYLLLENWFRVG